MAQMTVWTTDLIEDTKQKLRMGIQTDMSCFHDRNVELKAGNILMSRTAEELDEFTYCSRNIMYFVENYCRFLTDNGRTTVKLRPYQHEILSELGEEEWIKGLGVDGEGDYGPKNRNYILLAARQIGKCLFDGDVRIKNLDTQEEFLIPINLLYYFNKEHLTFLEKIKVKLMLSYHRMQKW